MSINAPSTIELEQKQRPNPIWFAENQNWIILATIKLPYDEKCFVSSSYLTNAYYKTFVSSLRSEKNPEKKLAQRIVFAA